MEKSKKAADYRLSTAFWVSLVLLGIASFWRLFVSLNKGLDIFAYIDFFLATAFLVIGALQQSKWRYYLIAAGLVVLVIFTQIVNQGFGFNLGGIFLSGNGLLSVRYASDLMYYVLMLAIAVLLVMEKHKTVGIVALFAAIFSLIYTGISIAVTTQYTGDFQIAWEWWVANNLIIPIYFVCTLLLAVTLFLFEYHKIDRYLKEKDKERKITKNTVKRSGRKIKD